MKLKFDEKGHLTPYKGIELSLKDFEHFFINQFDKKSTRRNIFKNYKNYVDDFQREITPDFNQWIDGSFVTKKANPNDIDFITLIDHEIYRQKRSVIDAKFRLKNAKEYYSVDAYTVEIYHEEHRKNGISKIDLVYWDNWFSKTKMNWAKKTFPKGYIILNFEKR